MIRHRDYSCGAASDLHGIPRSFTGPEIAGHRRITNISYEKELNSVQYTSAILKSQVSHSHVYLPEAFLSTGMP